MELFPRVVIDEIADKTDYNDHNGSVLTLLLFMRMDGIRGLDGYIDEIQEIMEIHQAARSMSTGLIRQRRHLMLDVMDIVYENYSNADEVAMAF